MAKDLGRISLHGAVSGAPFSQDSAAAILARALEMELNAARAAGRQEGLADQKNGGRALLEAAFDRLEGTREAAEQALASQAVELAVGIASELLRKELDAGRYDIGAIVREALVASEAGRGAVRVHLAPSDHARLDASTFRRGTELIADPELRPGDVHVETARGILVREIDETLATIRQRLMEEFA